MGKFKLKYKADNLIEFLASIDESDGSAVTNATGGSCVVALFDDNKDTRLSAAASTSQTVLVVEQTRGKRHGFEVGDELYIELTDGTYDLLEIVSIQHAASTITIETGLTSAASVRAAISVLLGQSITLVEFGDPEIPPLSTSTAWGWVGTIADTHVALEIGQHVRAQIECDGGPGLKDRSFLFATVEGES